MILFLYGPDTYRSRQKLNKIIARYRTIHRSGMSLKVLDAYEGNCFDVFKNSIQTTSMFSEKKLIVTKGGVNAKEFARLFMLWPGKEALKDSRDAVCVFYDEDTDKKSGIFKWLKNNSTAEEFTILSGARLLNCLGKYIKQNHINCDQRVLWSLVARNGGDLWGMTNELKKLTAYRLGEKITCADLDLFSADPQGANAFVLADALTYGNKPKALKLLNASVDSEDEARRIFGLLCWKFRTIAQSGRFEGAKLKKAYSILADLDIAVKTGKFSAKYALENFIFET